VSGGGKVHQSLSFFDPARPRPAGRCLSLYRFLFFFFFFFFLLNTPSYPPPCPPLSLALCFAPAFPPSLLPRRPLLGPVNPSCNPFLFRASRTLRALTYDGRVKFNEGDRMPRRISRLQFSYAERINNIAVALL